MKNTSKISDAMKAIHFCCTMLLIMLCIAFSSLPFSFSAPRRNMTQADWAIYSREQFMDSLIPIGIISLVLFCLNFLWFAFLPEHSKPLLKLLFARGPHYEAPSRKAFKNTVVKSAFWAALVALAAIICSASGNYQAYRNPPPYSSS